MVVPARRRWAGALCVAALALLLPLRGAAQDTQPTDLVVVVTDDTGAAVANQEVFVVVSNGAEVTGEFTGTTGADGAARFVGVAVGAGSSARSVAVYHDLPYRSDAVALTPGVAARLPITVLEVADTPANLHIDVLHIILTAVQPDLYQALQVLSVLNVDGRVAFGGEEFDGAPVGTVIPIPDNAINFTPLPTEISGLDPSRTAFDGDRVLDMRPVPAAGHQVAVQYEIGTAGGADIEIVVPYPTAQVSLLIGPQFGMATIESEQLREQDPVDIPQQGQYASYVSDVIPAGGALRFRIVTPGIAISVASWSLLALAMGLFAAAVASLFFSAPPRLDAAQRRRFIAAVAAIDEQHAARNISDADYYTRRAAAIGQLMELSGGAAASPDETGG